MKARARVRGSVNGNKEVIERAVVIADMPTMTKEQVSQYLNGNENVMGVLADVLGKNISSATITCDDIELFEDENGGDPDIVLRPIKR